LYFCGCKDSIYFFNYTIVIPLFLKIVLIFSSLSAQNIVINSLARAVWLI